MNISKTILLAGILFNMASSVEAADWHDASNYPARVIAFNFDTAVLDANTPVHFGSWTVSYASQNLPVMALVYGYYVTKFPPFQLNCSNAVSGQEGCAIQLIPADLNPGQPENCWVNGNNVHIQIPCPKSITFQY